MTTLVLLIIGMGMICNSQYWVVGVVIVLCSAAVAGKDGRISSLESELEQLKDVQAKNSSKEAK